MLLLTGYWPLSGNAFVIYPREGPVTLLAYDTEAWAIADGSAEDIRTFRAGTLGAADMYDTIERMIRDTCRSCGLQNGWIGTEQGFDTQGVGHGAAEVSVPAAGTRTAIGRALQDAHLVDAAPALRQSRAIKLPPDIERLRTANLVASAGLATFREMFEPGRSEVEIVAAVESAIMRVGLEAHGVREARAWAQLMTGTVSAVAWTTHPWATSRRIEQGDLGVLELGTVADGYWSDLTRTLVAGPASRQIVEMHEAVRAAQDAVFQGGRAGMTGGQIDALARTEIERRGFGDLFNHATGHGLGFDYHEPDPLLRPDDAREVTAGMASSVEPGVYLEGLGGVRVEDNVVFGEHGIDVLSEFDRAL